MRQLSVLYKTLDQKKLIKSANYVRHELTVRLAHRIREFQTLPYIVGTNPYFQNVYQLYWEAFNKIREVKEIQNLQENDDFVSILKEQLEAHVQVIPLLAMGISECCMMMTQRDMDRFIHDMLRTRIGRRLLGEQHLNLTSYWNAAFRKETSFSVSAWSGTGRFGHETVPPEESETAGHQREPEAEHSSSKGYFGVVCTSIKAHDILQKCVSVARQVTYDNLKLEAPQVVIEGGDVEFTYVPDHLEYILVELLKNSMRHTVKKHARSLPADDLDPASSSSSAASDPAAVLSTMPPVRVTIASVSNDLYFRVSDQGGGIAPQYTNSLYSFSRPPSRFANVTLDSQRKTPKDTYQSPNLPHVRLGFGLPMSKVYANYWGGELNVVSMDGYGTDAYLRIAKLGTNVEHLVME
jgi:hypothetical protein